MSLSPVDDLDQKYIKVKALYVWNPVDSQPVKCYIPIINNLWGVVKDMSRVSSLEDGQTHMTHILGAQIEDVVTEFISCMFH